LDPGSSLTQVFFYHALAGGFNYILLFMGSHPFAWVDPYDWFGGGM
jgi:hypothetical protein